MSAFETLVLNELKKNTVLLDSINSRIDQQEAEILSIKTNLNNIKGMRLLLIIVSGLKQCTRIILRGSI